MTVLLFTYIDRQTERKQTDKQTDRQTDRQIDKQTDRRIDRHQISYLVESYRHSYHLHISIPLYYTSLAILLSQIADLEDLY